jgi:hypothetical protein
MASRSPAWQTPALSSAVEELMPGVFDALTVLAEQRTEPDELGPVFLVVARSQNALVLQRRRASATWSALSPQPHVPFSLVARGAGGDVRFLFASFRDAAPQQCAATFAKTGTGSAKGRWSPTLFP